MPELGVHQCDNPECPYEVEARKPHGFSRKTASWAIGSYGLYLQENPEDWEVMREFAFAVALMNDLSVATEMLYTAYLNQPSLGNSPLAPVYLGIDDRTMRDLVVKCVKQAHRDQTAESWFIVAVMMQSEGRLDRAAEMLDRAAELGLDEAIVHGLETGLP
jgi:hypothetical protein